MHAVVTTAIVALALIFGFVAVDERDSAIVVGLTLVPVALAYSLYFFCSDGAERRCSFFV